MCQTLEGVIHFEEHVIDGLTVLIQHDFMQCKAVHHVFKQGTVSILAVRKTLIGGLELFNIGLQLCLGRTELLVGGLELLARGLQLLFIGLKLLIGGAKLLIGRILLLLAGTQLLIDRL